MFVDPTLCALQIYTYILYRLVLLYYTEIDPCKEDNGGCSCDASCISTDDGVKCTCNEGFTGNGQDCTSESMLTINTPQFNIRNVLDSADHGSGEESPSVGFMGESSVGSWGIQKQVVAFITSPLDSTFWLDSTLQSYYATRSYSVI